MVTSLRTRSAKCLTASFANDLVLIIDDHGIVVYCISIPTAERYVAGDSNSADAQDRQGLRPRGQASVRFAIGVVHSPFYGKSTMKLGLPRWEPAAGCCHRDSMGHLVVKLCDGAKVQPTGRR